MLASSYSVTLHHLAPGATAAGIGYPDEQLTAVGSEQLRDLLDGLGNVAKQLTIYEPATPEIRVKTDRDVFVIRTRYRRLHFVGWEATLRGEEHSINYILSTITGTTEPIKVAPKPDRIFVAASRAASTPQVEHGFMPRWAKIAVLGILIVGFNATTAWMLLRPVPRLVPQHELLPDFESRALLTKVAGEYLTGTHEGNRRLLIDSDGTLHLAKIGRQNSLTEERIKSARGAIVDGRAALMTSDPAVLTIKDADTVVYFNTTYRRRTP